MKNIAILLDQIDHVSFFSRFVNGLLGLGYAPVFITARPTLFLSARRYGHSVLMQASESSAPSAEDHRFSSVDVNSGMQSAAQAARLAEHVRQAVTRLLRSHGPVQLWLWNGGSTTAKAAAQAAHCNGTETRFFELANVPGRMQVDRDGVNADSSISLRPELLDRFDDLPSEAEFMAWLDDFAEAKRRPLPQAANVRKINVLYLADHLAWAAGWGLREDNRSLWAKARRALSKRKIAYDSALAPLDRPYIFLPLQKSNDTQVQLKSDIDNLQAIRIAIDLAREKNLRLYVKPHPAEEDPSFPAKLRSLRASTEFPVMLVSNHATDLIINSTEIVTINSTVGLEGILFGKKVTFLGQSQYKNMSLRRAKAYVFRYLTPIDYFSRDVMSEQQVRQALLGYASHRL